MHRYPAIHNAMWPGLVGKGPGSEPHIDLETMLDLTAGAEMGGVRFDGVDLFLAEPHTSIDSSDDDLKRLAANLSSRHLVAGSLVAPVWAPAGGGSAMGNSDERKRFVTQVRKACAIGEKLNKLGIRHYGIVRIDSAASPADWAVNPAENTRKIAETFKEACTIAESYGERLAAEGEICWGGMHSWRRMLELLERVGRPETLGFQAHFCEPVGHVQFDGDYVESWQPQAMSKVAHERARDMAGKVTAALGGLGIFGVELFVKGDEVWFSEVSPRPHDTGLVTLVSQYQSEFALHARAILGLPVSTALRSPGASAVIYGGMEAKGIAFDGVVEALGVPESELRLFGKPVSYMKRRMGVALARGANIDEARLRAKQAAALIKTEKS